MRIEFAKLLEECNTKRSNIFYKLNQLTAITGLSPRMLKYRMKEVKQKYKNIPSLLNRVGRMWQIHISIIDEFLPKRNRKGRTVNVHGWKYFVTWNFRNDYDTLYHIQLIKEIKSKIKPCRLKFAIEEDKRGIKHVHFISDANKIELTNVVELVLSTYLSKKDYRVEINDVNNKYSAIQYIGKSPLASGLL